MIGVKDTVYSLHASLRRLMACPPQEKQMQEDLEALPSAHSSLPTPDHSGREEQCFWPYALKFEPPNSSLLECSSSAEEDMFVNDLGISENYFSEPEIFDLGNEATISDIEKAIRKCKDLILTCEESTQRRRILVQRLIKLRLTLEKCKEEKEVGSEGTRVRQGHHLHLALRAASAPPPPPPPHLAKPPPSSKQYCDKCAQVIWALLHVTYRCSLCDYQCHGKCVKSKHPKCPSLKFSEDPIYIPKICPEVGLSSQDYRCAQCKNLVMSRTAWEEPRLCDYTGLYFCPACHWNTRMASPARIIHNWDFEAQLVSQQAKHFLTYIKAKPLLRLEELNPHLFKFVDELKVVKKLRSELILMKDYLRTCRMAQESRLLRRLEVRQHFVDNSDFYSVKDLVDLDQGTLTPYLKGVHRQFAAHIKETCEACRGKGFICELCNCEEVIFPFDDGISVCKICLGSFHESCFVSVIVCPRCIRQSSRRMKDQEKQELDNN